MEESVAEKLYGNKMPEQNTPERYNDYRAMTDHQECYQYPPNRSKSQDRIMASSSAKQKIRLASNSNERIYPGLRSRADSVCSSRNERSAKAKHILSGTQETLDSMRRELVEKDRLIENKNKEIIKLRMHCEDLKN